MSNMQKGLLNAVENVLPLSNHRYCVRHVEANWMKRFRTGDLDEETYVVSEEGSISSLKRKRSRTEEVEQNEEVFDVNSSAPQLTQEGIESDISATRQRQYEPFGPTRELESDPVLRPRIIFEELTRLKMRQNQQTRSTNRVITFRGDHREVSEPTDLPYSPH
ncbi:hypothetical protein KY285_010886 [Solanum tuberosum]|nr:hypothetical protein KY289_011459 [Solanum tuberosum]KAH0735179.1 hypothetical protein KY285_010886 [Solanum tuberosum]